MLSPGEIVKQFDIKKEALSKKWRDTKYIAYFQAGSNTFASLDELKRVYESVLDTDNLAGIYTATRPDCITGETAGYLSELGVRTGLDTAVELGLQTFHDKTAGIINRGYKLEVFEEAYKILAGYKIPVIIHIINGLPGENYEMMLETAKYIASLDPLPLGVKIHALYIEPGTEIYDLYNSGKINLPSKEEYIDIVVSQLEELPPEIVIMRLTGDPEISDKSDKTLPEWVSKKFSVINDIDKELAKRGTYQGKKLEKSGETHQPLSARGAEQKSLTNILSFAKRLLDVAINRSLEAGGGVYADFTMGNGHDTLYIKKKCPKAEIYAFDIQQKALEATKERLESENCFDENIYLIRDSHGNFRKYMPEETELDGAVFNLGYLPGGDKSITTLTESTLICLKGALEILKAGGVIVVCVYPGHSEGTREGEKIFEFAENLDRKIFDCLYHRLINIPEAPFVIAFQKK